MEALRAIEEAELEEAHDGVGYEDGEGLAAAAWPAAPSNGQPPAQAASSSQPLPPPPPPPIVLPDGSGRAASQLGVRARAPREAWGRIYHPNGSGYIRASQTTGSDTWDLRAVCTLHGVCSLTRGCRSVPSRPSAGRPLGLLWSYLTAAPEYAAKQVHRGAVDTWSSPAARANARAQFTLEGLAERFEAMERPLRDGEPVEPESVP